mmetsp:Transcript_76035/g.211293  ORF Transcript_76035/g.211293 Transcript_76035/m.211293 type:complete len:243 (+) Transcript_76035:376-1104(+)
MARRRGRLQAGGLRDGRRPAAPQRRRRRGLRAAFGERGRRPRGRERGSRRAREGLVRGWADSRARAARAGHRRGARRRMRDQDGRSRRAVQRGAVRRGGGTDAEAVAEGGFRRRRAVHTHVRACRRQRGPVLAEDGLVRRPDACCGPGRHPRPGATCCCAPSRGRARGLLHRLRGRRGRRACRAGHAPLWAAGRLRARRCHREGALCGSRPGNSARSPRTRPRQLRRGRPGRRGPPARHGRL